MKTRHRLSFVVWSFAGLMSLGPSPALAAEGDPASVQAECVSAFETSQELRASGDLMSARNRLISCIRPECPGAVRTECSKWLEQVEREVPTFVVVAKADGEDRTEVTVEMDGTVIQETLDGKAIQVNPGSHVFRFTLPPFEPIEKRVVVTEGEKLRSISVEFQSPRRAKRPEPDAQVARRTHRPVPVPVFVLGGVAVLGAASFAYFGATGTSKQDDLQSTCAPSCKSQEVQDVRRSYLLADVSLGVGAAALITGAVLYFTRPSAPEEGVQVGVGPTTGGFSTNARFRF